LKSKFFYEIKNQKKIIFSNFKQNDYKRLEIKLS
jgi:hypothetical protein